MHIYDDIIRFVAHVLAQIKIFVNKVDVLSILSNKGTNNSKVSMYLFN